MKKIIDVKYKKKNKKVELKLANVKIYNLFAEGYNYVSYVNYNCDMEDPSIHYEAEFSSYVSEETIITKKDKVKLKKLIEEYCTNLKVTDIKIKEMK